MTAALIIASETTANNRGWSPLDDIGGVSAIRRILMVFKQAQIAKTVVITDVDDTGIPRHCSHMGTIFLQGALTANSDEISCVKTGLNYLKGRCSRVLIVPAYISLFTAKTVRTLCDTDHALAVPSFSDKPGYPVLLSGKLFDVVINYKGTGKLANALTSAGIPNKKIGVDDRGISFDVRGKYNYGNLINSQELRRIRPEVKVQLVGEQGFFGPGAFLLLTLIQETGSIKDAAKLMGVSYSKANKLILLIEGQLGYDFFYRQQGGIKGGNSIITDKGLDYLARYKALVADINKSMEDSYNRHFGDIDYWQSNSNSK